MLRFLLILTLILLPVRFYPQENDISNIISIIAEEMAADESDPGTLEIFTDRLRELAEDPVFINSADEDEIARLFFLTPLQVRSLADHVKSTGNIVSVYEIANIPGFDRETAQSVSPFITLDSSPAPGYAQGRAGQTITTSFMVKPSVTDTSSFGSPARVLVKYRLNAGRVSASFTGEKDPGEKLFPDHPGIMDFVSASLGYNGPGIIKRFIIGDYSVRFGQGLNINTAYKTNLSLTSPGYLAGTSDIKPYSSTDENNFMRGIALSTSFRNMEVSGYLSSNRIDATLSDPGDTSGTTVVSIYKTGYHNSRSSLQKKDNIIETAYGINISVNFGMLKTGLALTTSRLSIPVRDDPGSITGLYDFTGNSNNLGSLYYSWIIRKTLIFGEASSSGRNSFSIIQGFSIRPVNRLSINLLLHYYSPSYVSLHGKSPGIGSDPANERGIYANFTYEAWKNLYISGGTDYRYFPWLRYRCSSPSYSRKTEIRLRYTPLASLTLEGLCGFRYTETDDPADKGVPAKLGARSGTARVLFKYKPSESFSTATRFDYRNVDQSGKKGYLVFQELNIRSGSAAIWMRYCIFTTDGYETGIYTWENDLPGTYSVPVLFGHGNRFYIMASYKPTGSIEMRIKYGATSRISDGNYFPELRIQVKISV